jgi:hypothetical protein
VREHHAAGNNPNQREHAVIPRLEQFFKRKRLPGVPFVSINQIEEINLGRFCARLFV